ncbi:glucokinase [Pseudomarimonas arenosa]|uniref:Glucokinase n=1 Tax=Pseudomarimonas arenosa TaxID=2774145 RepID=A0AAW3ZMI4_9GAMM|nr:glucokinase [Pseudomarimonas arenosa]MBD8527358.1 glucokinase [Pseudomarimonas arenosa]
MTARLVNPGLVADIGGTNARFGLTDLARPGAEILYPRSLPTADYASLQHAAQAYLAEIDQRPHCAALALASPVQGDEVRLTNRAWSFSQAELRAVLGLDFLRVLNDFGAVAAAVPHLSQPDRNTLHGDSQGGLQGPVSVLGPGTGLGVALLVGSDDHWQVVETEGGHVSFAPLGEEELCIDRWISARFGRTSNERLLCGQGLSYIHAALSGEEAGRPLGKPHPLRDPADIVAAALDGHDLLARRTLARFCAVLGSVAGDTALMHGARTVMIAGGIVPRFVPFLRSSAFRERFLAKGRFAAYLESVAIHVITHPNPGLLGAAVTLHQICKEGMA